MEGKGKEGVGEGGKTGEVRFEGMRWTSWLVESLIQTARSVIKGLTQGLIVLKLHQIRQDLLLSKTHVFSVKEIFIPHYKFVNRNTVVATHVPWHLSKTTHLPQTFTQGPSSVLDLLSRHPAYLLRSLSISTPVSSYASIS